MNLIGKSAVLAGLLALQGCSTLVERTAGWPGNLPDRRYFAEVYQSDAANAAVQTEAEYLNWVRCFYEGSEIYPWGYLDLESTVLAGMGAETTEHVKTKLDAIGMQIGSEWAKDRGASVIHTAMLSVWAEALQSAAASGQADSVTDAIAADVAALLSGELQESAIEQGRYGLAFNVVAFDYE